ncbi:CmcI family methyltransferase, partial [Mycobacterium tuberculosis]|uniref:CmcI family methyltransferase n=1 Tax=Mycobacterium tuberculosis TaxID=1773 RepID=UPI002549EDC0
TLNARDQPPAEVSDQRVSGLTGAVHNGHPVLPGFGPGPYEAIEAYEDEFPNDYKHDAERENKFGWTSAPNGFLIRN